MYCPDDIFLDRFEIEDPNPSIFYHLEEDDGFYGRGRDIVIDDDSCLSEGEEAVIMGVEYTPAEVDCFDLMQGR